MDRQTSLNILHRIAEHRQKQAEVDQQKALQIANARQLRLTEGKRQQAIQQEAINNIKRTFLASLGVGVGARGLMGMYNTIKRDLSPVSMPAANTAVLPLPVPVSSFEAEEKKRKKTASESWFEQFLSGKKSKTIGGIPWSRPATVAAAIGGAGLGWKGVDHVLDQSRREEIEQEVKDAEKDFLQALISQYEQPVKLASEASLGEKLGQALDQLYNQSKQANLDAETLAGESLGLYGAYAVPTALIGGYAAYNAAKKRRSREILQKALQRRRQRRQATQPADIYAMPVPVEVEY